MTEPHRTVFRTADGLDLVADRYGAPIRGGVLLAHGGGQTRHAWAKTAAALADRGWEAVALDLRGHGDSGWSPFAKHIALQDPFFPDLFWHFSSLHPSLLPGLLSQQLIQCRGQRIYPSICLR